MSFEKDRNSVATVMYLIDAHHNGTMWWLHVDQCEQRDKSPSLISWVAVCVAEFLDQGQAAGLGQPVVKVEFSSWLGNSQLSEHALVLVQIPDKRTYHESLLSPVAEIKIKKVLIQLMDRTNSLCAGKRKEVHGTSYGGLHRLRFHRDPSLRSLVKHHVAKPNHVVQKPGQYWMCPLGRGTDAIADATKLPLEVVVRILMRMDVACSR